MIAKYIRLTRRPLLTIKNLSQIASCKNNRRSFFVSPRIRNAEEQVEPREQMEFDVVIVGAGPSGLSTAIRLKQLAQEKNKELNICVVEKGSEVGRHILSGACIEPRGLDELIPNWRELNCPLNTPVTRDSFRFLTEKRSFPIPIIEQQNNHGNYIGSLGLLTKWLGEQATELGVDIFEGFGGDEVLYDDKGNVIGIATNDMGVDKNGKKKDTFQRGMELLAKQTVFAEGCRGSLTKTLYANKQLNLRKDSHPQAFGIGIKELWEVDPSVFEKGLVQHSVGWPLKLDTYGGSFMYHYGENLVSVGFVIGLDYKNPYLNPYMEFQRFKHHPLHRYIFENGKCIQYGARALVEGGLNALPKLSFPGGVIVGDSAGFLNITKIKGTHTAIKSGILAAEAIWEALEKGDEEAKSYEERFKSSWLYKELYRERNTRAYFQKFGLYGGLFFTGLDSVILKGKTPWTLHHTKEDHERLLPKDQAKPIEYPKPDGKISFDLLTNLSRSGTNHSEDQLPHLRIIDEKIPVEVNLKVYDGPEQRYCPARVYEFVDDEKGEKKLQINYQNCVHCKTCDIKDPKQNINWTIPKQLGGGPAYDGM